MVTAIITAPRRQKGFTLIEILMVTALSFVGLMGMVAMQVSALHANSQSRYMTEAVGLAQDKLEALGHTAIASLASATESGLGPQGVAVAGGAYTRTTTVATANGITTIKVQVAWLDVAGKSHNVKVFTVRAP